MDLTSGDNFIYIYTLNTQFDLQIKTNNIELKKVNINELNKNYIIKKNYYYDVQLKKGKYFFLLYINDKSNTNYYEINIKGKNLNEYFKFDNFYNFNNHIYIEQDDIYTISIKMNYLIPILKFIIISNETIQNMTDYENKNNMYKINPIVVNNKILNLNSYYIEVQFIHFNDDTLLSFDKNNKIILKIKNNKLFINKNEIKKYNYKKKIKLFLKKIQKLTVVYYYDDWSENTNWIKILTIENDLHFYQKLFDLKINDSHINQKVIKLSYPYIIKYDIFNFLHEINIYRTDNRTNVISKFNNYYLQLGGNISNIFINENKKLKLNYINCNYPITEYTIDNKRNRLITFTTRQ